MTTQGLSGLVKFDYKGRRMDFNLDVTELSKDGMQKVRPVYTCLFVYDPI